jgi:hypothetical protein
MKRVTIARQRIGLICWALLCAILLAALWPFRVPANEVSWLHERNGVRFGRYGTISSRGEFQAKNASSPSYTLEIYLTPASTRHWHSIVTFYSKQNHSGFGLGQTSNDLFLMRHTLNQRGHWRTAAYAGGVFRKQETLLLTVAAGPGGSEVYVNGAYEKALPEFPAKADDITGELVIATSPAEDAGWPGELHGLAIYDRELTPEQIVRDYAAWEQNGAPDPENMKTAAAVYGFNERAGHTVHDKLHSAPDLYIARMYKILDGRLLTPFWKEYSGDWGYWESALLNVFGFVPLGSFVCAYCSLAGVKKPVLVATLLGGVLSLSIEILQAYLPTRDSGTTDIITNTSGTAIGAVMFKFSFVQALLRKLCLFATESDAPTLPSPVAQ